MTLTDKQFTDRGWTRPTVRLSPGATEALRIIQSHTHESVGQIVRRVLIKDAKWYTDSEPRGTDRDEHVCAKCGLVYLKNEATRQRIRVGCWEYEDEPGPR